MSGEDVRVPRTSWGRSWFMLRQMLLLLREDRALLAVAGLGTLVTLGAAVAIFGGAAALLHVGPRRDHYESYHVSFGLVLSFGLMFPVALLATALNVVLVAMAQARLDGRRMDVGEALAFCARRWRPIVGWTLLDTGIGALLNRLAAILPVGGAIASWLGATAWSLASMFAVPALVVEDVGPIEATRRSVALFRARWGEGASATLQAGALGLALTLPGIVLLGVGLIAGFRTPGQVAITLCGAAITALGVVLGVPTFGLGAGELDAFVSAPSPRRGRFS